MRAIRIERFGGPEVLEVDDHPEPLPGPGQQVFEVLASGVNYADTHQTENSYLAKQSLPLIPGSEVVVRGPDGGRLLGLIGSGGYADRVAVDPATLFAVPDAVSDGQALVTLVQGATAWHLLRSSVSLRPGDCVVVHAGAGGVGSIAIQLARRWGAGRVIATASDERKRALCLELGADEAVDSRSADLRQALRDANGGRGVDVVLEMTGGSVFDASLAALAPWGRLVTYGRASREPATPIDPRRLTARSTAVIGFWLAHVLQRPALFAEAVTDLLSMLATGDLRAVIGGTYALAEAAQAHRALLARTTVGKLVLDPQA